MRRRRGHVLRLATLIAVLGVSAPALAQPRVHRELMPDLDYAEPVAPDGGRLSAWDRGGRALWQGAAEAGRADTDGGLALSGKLRAGQRLERDSMMRMRSAVRWRADDSGGAILAGLEGVHDLEGRLGFGDPKRDRLGFDLALDGRVEHTGGHAPALRPADRAPGALFAAGVGVEGGLRLTNRATGAEAVGLSLPIGYRVDGVDYRDPAAPLAGATTETWRAALAYRIYDRHALDAWVTLLSLSRARTRFEPAAAAAARLPVPPLPPRPMAGELQVTELRVGDLDVTFFEDDILAGMRAHYGWAWMSEPGTERADNLFTFNYAMHIAGDGKRVGLAFGRSAAHTPDGGRLLADWRVEIEGGLTLDRIHVASGLGASWLDDVEHDDASTLGRYSLDNEAFAALGRGLEVGLYQITSYEPRGTGAAPVDPWLQPEGWGVETGIFLRARGQD